jgi:hypothetical protein
MRKCVQGKRLCNECLLLTSPGGWLDRAESLGALLL